MLWRSSLGNIKPHDRIAALGDYGRYAPPFKDNWPLLKKLDKLSGDRRKDAERALEILTKEHIIEENQLLRKLGVLIEDKDDKSLADFRSRWCTWRQAGKFLPTIELELQIALRDQEIRDIKLQIEADRIKRQLERKARAGIPDCAYIYVIGRPNHPVKIGFSENVDARLSNLQTCHPEKLGIYFELEVIPKWARKVEKGCHIRLAVHRQEGEWFDVTPEEAIEVVKAIATEMGATV